MIPFLQKPNQTDFRKHTRQIKKIKKEGRRCTGDTQISRQFAVCIFTDACMRETEPQGHHLAEPFLNDPTSKKKKN